MDREGFRRKPDNCSLKKRGERSQGRVHFGARAEKWIGAKPRTRRYRAKRRPLTAEGRQPLSLAADALQKETQVWRRGMQQSQLTTYPDIGEVRTVTSAATCNQLLAAGWVLLGVVPLTTVREMGAGQPRDGEQNKRIEDTRRYVRRSVIYVVGKRLGS
jgi:hypothetical protein